MMLSKKVDSFEHEQEVLKQLSERYDVKLKAFKKAVMYFLYTGCFHLDGVSRGDKLVILGKLKELYYE